MKRTAVEWFDSCPYRSAVAWWIVGGMAATASLVSTLAFWLFGVYTIIVVAVAVLCCVAGLWVSAHWSLVWCQRAHANAHNRLPTARERAGCADIPIDLDRLDEWEKRRRKPETPRTNGAIRWYG